MHHATLSIALAHWMIGRLTDTLDRPLDGARTYGLTVVDPADLDPTLMQVRAAFLAPADTEVAACRGSNAAVDAKPDALASASRVWLVPGSDVVKRLSRPHEFARRRPALAVAVVDDHDMAVAMRFEDDAEITAVEPGRAAGLLVPVLLRWQAFDGHPSTRRPERGAA
jgi:hypothetical protein